MSRFFFDLYEGGRTVEDMVGIDLPDLEAARRQALVVARQRISEEVLAGRLCLSGMVLIADAARRSVGRLLFRNAVTVRSL